MKVEEAWRAYWHDGSIPLDMYHFMSECGISRRIPADGVEPGQGYGRQPCKYCMILKIQRFWAWWEDSKCP